MGVKNFDEVGELPGKFQKHPLGKASIKIMLNLTKIKNTLEERHFWQKKKFKNTLEERPPEKIMLKFKIQTEDGCFSKKIISKEFKSELCVNHLANHQSEV